MALFKAFNYLNKNLTHHYQLTNRKIQSTSIFFNNMSKFEEAKKKLTTLNEEPDNENKLKLYALFKQSTVGPCNTKKPGMMDFVGKAKWEAWNSLGSMKLEDAQLGYAGLVESLFSKQAPSASSSASSASSSPNDEVVVTVDGKITLIKLNRPAKKNALLFGMYDVISKALDTAAKDKSSMVVITGAGDYYCSGNDLSNFMVDPSTIDKVAADGKLVLQKFVSAYIDFPKPLVALVNGPAVGISVTLLGLCDLVYASDQATFHTPFISLGQSPEGCSSFTFPMIMGSSMANEVLLFGKKLTAAEALDCGLISRIFPAATFHTDAWESVKKLSMLPPQSLQLSKSLIRNAFKANLHAVNNQECALLESRWKSEECMNAIMSFFQKKSSKL